MQKIILPILFVTCFLVSCYGIEDCGSEVGELVKMTITGCDDLEERCTLHRNTNVTLTMKFDLKQDIETVTAVVYGVILDVPVPFPLPNSDGCKDSGLTCPLKAGGPYTYTAIMPVQRKYPKVTVTVKWELRDEKGKLILCSLIDSKIQ